MMKRYVARVREAERLDTVEARMKVSRVSSQSRSGSMMRRGKVLYRPVGYPADRY
jgi:hypothetical protein